MADRDRDEIIMSLTEIADQLTEDGMVDGVNQQTIRDALELLKEQEAVMWAYDGYDCFKCSNCDLCVKDEVYYMMDKPISFCPGCGRKVKWDAPD